MAKYILAIDQGTTSSRAILFNDKGEKCFTAQEEIRLIYPHEGWVECDPLQIWKSVVNVITDIMITSGATWEDIDSIGITNQRETSIIWDKNTGKPIYNAIVWQSRQSSKICEKFAKHESVIHNKTGLIVNPYFSASKIRFILDEVEGAQERAEKGELLFGTVDTWLIWKMTNGKVHATDTTNASRTLLYNIFNMEWDNDLCKLFNIPVSLLPEVKSSKADYGELEALSSKVKILGVAGDQQASLFGHTCFKQGEVKNTYGTGCFMLMNIGEKPIFSKNGLLTTIAWTLDGKTTYALEGSVFIGGAAIQWLRDGLRAVEEASDCDHFATKVENSGGVYFVPAFVGLGTPYWDDDVRGSMFGMTRATNKAHIVRATLEAIAYQSKDVFDVMQFDSGIDIKSLQVDGGAANSEVLMQFQSDICQIDIKKPTCLETTALGVCYLAGLQSGFFSSMNDIKKSHDFKKTFVPSIDSECAEKLCKGWKIAVNAARSFKL